MYSVYMYTYAHNMLCASHHMCMHACVKDVGANCVAGERERERERERMRMIQSCLFEPHNQIRCPLWQLNADAEAKLGCRRCLHCCLWKAMLLPKWTQSFVVVKTGHRAARAQVLHPWGRVASICLFCLPLSKTLTLSQNIVSISLALEYTNTGDTTIKLAGTALELWQYPPLVKDHGVEVALKRSPPPLSPFLPPPSLPSLALSL